MTFMTKEPRGVFVKQSKEPVVERIASLVKRYPSRSAAARAWGVNINTLKSYFRKDGCTPEPRENLLARIAENEGVSFEWLKDGDGESPITPKKPKRPSGAAEEDRLSEMLSFLTHEERDTLTTVLARKGVETVLCLLEEDIHRLLHLKGRKRLAALMLADMPDERVREILEEIERGVSPSVTIKAR